MDSEGVCDLVRLDELSPVSATVSSYILFSDGKGWFFSLFFLDGYGLP